MSNLEQNKKIDLQEAVSILGVSSATIRNWVKHDFIQLETRNSQLFDYRSIKELRNKIEGGEILRLHSRANKRNSTATFLPVEYIDKKENIDSIKQIVSSFAKYQIAKDWGLFVLALNLLKQSGLVLNKDLNSILTFKENLFKSKNLRRELLNWYASLSKININERYQELFNLDLPRISDTLGCIYQALAAQGDKAQAGSYYTPSKVVDDIIQSHISEPTAERTLFDPCCGTGQFLIQASKYIVDPQNLWGFDSDPIAVNLAKINLFLQFPNEDFKSNIYCKNTLFQNSNSLFSAVDSLPQFDYIVTNPPWGAHFGYAEMDYLKKSYSEIQSLESFSYFLLYAIRSLKKGGVLSFILPESILYTKTHQDIRKVILDTMTIMEIVYLDRLFQNVFTPVIRIDLKKETPQKNTFFAKKDEISYRVEQDRLNNNKDFAFDVYVANKDLEIIEKIFSFPHTTLKDHAAWALGIVTGNNKKYLQNEKTPTNEPILTGKEVCRYTFKSPSNYINFNPEKFQQAAPANKYRAKEKLIYKFISKELVLAYDKGQTLTLNSANILIPVAEYYPIKVILALFNSTIYQFIYQKKFNSIKVLRSNLEQLPLPLWSKEIIKEIIVLVEKVINSNVSSNIKQDIFEKLDAIIAKEFKLTSEEFKHIKISASMSKKLLFYK